MLCIYIVIPGKRQLQLAACLTECTSCKCGTVWRSHVEVCLFSSNLSMFGNVRCDVLNADKLLENWPCSIATMLCSWPFQQDKTLREAEQHNQWLQERLLDKRTHQRRHSQVSHMQLPSLICLCCFTWKKWSAIMPALMLQNRWVYVFGKFGSHFFLFKGVRVCFSVLTPYELMYIWKI